MTYDQYWNGDVWMVEAFRKAEELRQERTDSEAWLSGSYVARAIEATIGNAFIPKGHEKARYPEEPYILARRAEEERVKTAKQEDFEIARARLYMQNMMRAGKNWGQQ